VLEVAHERSVRRIADEVVERPRGSLFLAVGRSARVRAQVEAELRDRAPELAHAVVTLRGDEGPWWRILKTKDELGRPDGEVLLSVAGLGEMTEEELGRILGHLNLGREERVLQRLHMLLWVGGLDGLDRFRRDASDLWGHRSGVLLFLSREDFAMSLGEPTEKPQTWESRLQEVRTELMTSTPATRQIRLLTELALHLDQLGRFDEAFTAVEQAKALLVKEGGSTRERAEAAAAVLLRELEVLLVADRTEEAFRIAMQARGVFETDPLTRILVNEQLARMHADAGRIAEAMACRAEAMDTQQSFHFHIWGGQGVLLQIRARLFCHLGALDSATRDASASLEEVEWLADRSQEDRTTCANVHADVDRVRAAVSLLKGDPLNALANAQHGVVRAVDLSAKRQASLSLSQVADAYRQLGLLADARYFTHQATELLEHRPGPIAGVTRWLAASDACEDRVEVAIARYESAVTIYRVAANVERGPHRRGHWLRVAAEVLYRDLAPLAGRARCLEAEKLLVLAAQAADEASSPEQRALTGRSRAFLAEAREQWAEAEAEHLAFLAWAEANWGPYKRAEVLLDLARVARERGDLARAVESAERARREVEMDPPEYRNRFTAIATDREIARIRKEQGDLPAAHAALEHAVAVAQGDGLRLREREVLIDLAELPPAPGRPDQRIEHAQRARAIAQDASFPVDEAEATLVLAGLHLRAGQARRARALFDQVAWIVDRIGSRAVRERAAQLRSELGT
jgi:tetratricopeptide (TPR) repeat protein